MTPFSLITVQIILYTIFNFLKIKDILSKKVIEDKETQGKEK